MPARPTRVAGGIGVAQISKHLEAIYRLKPHIEVDGQVVSGDSQVAVHGNAVLSLAQQLPHIRVVLGEPLNRVR
jgi:hypothetical protein